MVSKKILISLFIAVSLFAVYYNFDNPKQEAINKKNFKVVKKDKNFSNLEKKQEPTEIKPRITYDLYSKTQFDLPLISIYDISKLTPEIKSKVDSILDKAQGFYYLKVLDDRVFVILQNPIDESNTYARHNLQFVEILFDGRIFYHNAGYVGLENEIQLSINSKKNKENLWVIDENIESYRPLKHIAYDEKGKIKFIETWNYDDNEPVKYEMRNENKKIISILKESQDDISNLRREHIFYDNDGNIIMSLTINYEGANISRLMFYNSHSSIDSVNIISEYDENGLKIKESVYDENYMLINTVYSVYQNDERKSLRVLDFEGNELSKLES